MAFHSLIAGDPVGNPIAQWLVYTRVAICGDCWIPLRAGEKFRLPAPRNGRLHIPLDVLAHLAFVRGIPIGAVKFSRSCGNDGCVSPVHMRCVAAKSYIVTKPEKDEFLARSAALDVLRIARRLRTVIRHGKFLGGKRYRATLRSLNKPDMRYLHFMGLGKPLCKELQREITRIRDLRARSRKWQRKKSQPRAVVRVRVCNAINKVLRQRGARKTSRTFTALGYTQADLVAHIERQFLPRMGWHNRHLWHIDHVVPLSSFKFTSMDDPEFKAAWALTNLRPLWSRENVRKHAKRTHLL